MTSVQFCKNHQFLAIVLLHSMIVYWHHPYTTGQWSLNAAEVCGLRTQADADPQWLLDPRTDSKRIFFIQRSKCCDHNEYSVKILHAVRPAITAIAELLVGLVSVLQN